MGFPSFEHYCFQMGVTVIGFVEHFGQNSTLFFAQNSSQINLAINDITFTKFSIDL